MKMKDLGTLLDDLEAIVNEKMTLFQEINNITLQQADEFNNTFEEPVNGLKDVPLLGKMEGMENLVNLKQELLDNLESVDLCLEQRLEEHEHLLRSNLEEHVEQINRIKALMISITLLTEQIKLTEQKNKNMFENKVKDQRQGINTFRKSKTAASKYSQNMPHTHKDDQSYFLDRKK